MYATRPWLRNYPKGVPANIDENQFENLNSFFEESFAAYKYRVAFENMGKELTFAQLDRYSKNFAAYLHSRGLVPGDKIAIMMPNCLQYPIDIVGALRAGLIIVNTNPLYTQREMLYQFNDSEAKAIIILENFAHNLQAILPSTKIKVTIVTSLGEMLGSVKGTMVNFVIRHVKRLVPKYEIANTVNFMTCLNDGSKFSINSFENKAHDVVLLQYTGGTTGVSKGAMLTNQNLVANMLQMKTWLGTHLSTTEGQVCLSPLPMYHIFAFTVNCLAMINFGVKTVLVSNPRDIGSIIKEFKTHKISIMTGLNTLFNALLNHKDFAGLDFSALNITVSGGMALQNAIAERWAEVTGCKIAEGYGMTESSPVLTVNKLGEGIMLGTIGLPVSSTEVRIVDDYGNDVPVGQSGEIIARGPQIMKGYYNRVEETNKTLKDGWLYTGDIGYMDNEGFFRIVDRKKDMILVSGFNVYPNEIEDVIAKMPKVLEVAAVGKPSESSGESVKVFIVKKDNSLTADEVLAYCKENLTGYKMPKEVEFRTELPKTNVGKILRRELR